jgi:hypothetical protein
MYLMHFMCLCAQNVILGKFKVKKILEGKYSLRRYGRDVKKAYGATRLGAQSTEHSGGKERIGRGYRWAL